MNNLLPKFSNGFQKKIRNFRRWQDAQLSLLGRELLIKGIDQMEGNYSFKESDLKFDAYNKPFLNRTGWNFNISHSGELVVCAITTMGDIGIDVEKVGKINFEDFKSQMTKNEWDKIQTSNDKEKSFFNYWTQKEAVLKVDGKGLSIPLKSFEIIDEKTFIHTDLFFVKEVSVINGYCCHLASKINLEPVEIKILTINY